MTTLEYHIPKKEVRQPGVPRLALFFVLLAVGMAGVATLWWMPMPAGIDPSITEATFKMATLAQAAIQLVILLLVGLFTAPRVGLAAPYFQALVSGGVKWRALAPMLAPALIGGLFAALILAIYALLQPQVTPELVASDVQTDMPMLMRVLYGGITEELLLRWGVMSLLVWLGWRFGQRRNGTPHSRWFWIGIVITAVLFGIGHLPAAAALGMALTPLSVSFIVFFNAAVGLIYGWLYWRKGLEAAMIAHAATHVIAVWILLPVLGF